MIENTSVCFVGLPEDSLLRTSTSAATGKTRQVSSRVPLERLFGTVSSGYTADSRSKSLLPKSL